MQKFKHTISIFKEFPPKIDTKLNFRKTAVGRPFLILMVDAITVQKVHRPLKNALVIKFAENPVIKYSIFLRYHEPITGRAFHPRILTSPLLRSDWSIGYMRASGIPHA